VQAVVRRLQRERVVGYAGRIGNAHTFQALVSRQEVETAVIDEMLRRFGGRPATLLFAFAESGRISTRDLKKATRAIRRRQTDR
jgi:hypothetical protein